MKPLLELAELIDAWRVFPRLFLSLFYIVVAQTHVWYTGLADPSTGQGLYVTAVWGATAAVTKFYVDSGRKWS